MTLSRNHNAIGKEDPSQTVSITSNANGESTIC